MAIPEVPQWHPEFHEKEGWIGWSVPVDWLHLQVIQAQQAGEKNLIVSVRDAGQKTIDPIDNRLYIRGYLSGNPGSIEAKKVWAEDFPPWP